LFVGPDGRRGQDFNAEGARRNGFGALRMSGLQVLLLADDRPGHYHLSQGVVAALKRLADVETTELRISRRALVRPAASDG